MSSAAERAGGARRAFLLALVAGALVAAAVSGAAGRPASASDPPAAASIAAFVRPNPLAVTLRLEAAGAAVTARVLVENRGDQPLFDLDATILVPDDGCISVHGPDRRHRGRLGALAASEAVWRLTAGSVEGCGAQVIVARVAAVDETGLALVKESEAHVVALRAVAGEFARPRPFLRKPRPTGCAPLCHLRSAPAVYPWTCAGSWGRGLPGGLTDLSGASPPSGRLSFRRRA